MAKPSTITPEHQAEFVRLRLQEDMGPAAIVEYAKALGWKTSKGKAIKKHHVDTVLYPRPLKGGKASNSSTAANGGPTGVPVGTPPSDAQETAETGGVEIVPTMELLAIDERRALPGYMDEDGEPIRPQGARLELYKASRICYKIALGDYQKARDRNFDRCESCGMTHDKLLRRVGQGLRMADGILVSAEGSEERAARVQITQLNFNMGGAGEGPSDPDTPEASSEPVLNVDLVRLLGAYLGEHDLKIEGFFAYVRQERTQA